MQNTKLSIVYEDNDVIVINKPAGIASHPKNAANQQTTIVGLLLQYYPPLAKVGEDKLRPGIVHRLDKDTSGLMVIAKNQESFFHLKKQFAERKVEKKYLALVVGRPKNKTGRIEKELGRYKIKQTVSGRPKTKIKEFKKAITEYKVLKEYQDFSLCEARPLTGRTHQIRIHFASIGHPIAGDKMYGFKHQSAPPGLERHFLHASYLKFSSKPGKVLAFRCDLPEELKEALKNLN